jgi:hypothetical protein
LSEPLRSLLRSVEERRWNLSSEKLAKLTWWGRNGRSRYQSPRHLGYCHHWYGGVSPTVYAALGRGDGTFGNPVSYITGSLFSNDVKAADFNGDGEIDLALATEQGIFYFPGNGAGTFGSPILTPMPFGVIVTVLGDFNGDGKPDLAMTGSDNLSVFIALGNGDGTFQAPLPFAATYYPRGYFTAGDFNSDAVLI